ncbi:hypothetical protein HY573_02415 [Candidatus Parcubacteria bacterium]|nr:hypothetical protein [Candidatus Parcubacteria bacterium]
MRSWWWLLAAIPVILILRIAGFIGNVWTGFGVVALLAFLALLERFPTMLQKWIAIFFTGWVIIFIGAPAVWNGFLSTRPLTREALMRRHIANDLVQSELADPAALKAKIGLKAYCRRIETLREMWWLQEAANIPIVTNPQTGLPTPDPARQQRLYNAIRIIEGDRDYCRQVLLPSLPKVPQRPPQANFTTWVWVVLFGLGALVIASMFIKPLAGAIVPLAIIAALAIGFLWYTTDGKTALAQIAQPAAPPAVAYWDWVSPEYTESKDVETDYHVDPGQRWEMWASMPYAALFRQPDGSIKPDERPAGHSGNCATNDTWRGGPPAGPLGLRVQPGLKVKIHTCR